MLEEKINKEKKKESHLTQNKIIPKISRRNELKMNDGKWQGLREECKKKQRR